MLLPIGAYADTRRRASVACPARGHGHGCSECESGRNCFVQWQYPIRNDGPYVSLQYPTCAHSWIADTLQSARHRVDMAAQESSLAMLTLVSLFLVGLAIAVGTRTLQLRLERWHYDRHFGD